MDSEMEILDFEQLAKDIVAYYEYVPIPLASCRFCVGIGKISYTSNHNNQVREAACSCIWLRRPSDYWRNMRNFDAGLAAMAKCYLAELENKKVAKSPQ